MFEPPGADALVKGCLGRRVRGEDGVGVDHGTRRHERHHTVRVKVVEHRCGGVIGAEHVHGEHVGPHGRVAVSESLQHPVPGGVHHGVDTAHGVGRAGRHRPSRCRIGGVPHQRRPGADLCHQRLEAFHSPGRDRDLTAGGHHGSDKGRADTQGGTHHQHAPTGEPTSPAAHDGPPGAGRAYERTSRYSSRPAAPTSRPMPDAPCARSPRVRG